MKRRERQQAAGDQPTKGERSLYELHLKVITVVPMLKRCRAVATETMKEISVTHADVVLHSDLRKATREEMEAQVLELKPLLGSLLSKANELLQLVAEQMGVFTKKLTRLQLRNPADATLS